jgi:Xaa-Pro aminopeptidase
MHHADLGESDMRILYSLRSVLSVDLEKTVLSLAFMHIVVHRIRTLYIKGRIARQREGHFNEQDMKDDCRNFRTVDIPSVFEEFKQQKAKIDIQNMHKAHSLSKTSNSKY